MSQPNVSSSQRRVTMCFGEKLNLIRVIIEEKRLSDISFPFPVPGVQHGVGDICSLVPSRDQCMSGTPSRLGRSRESRHTQVCV